MRHLLIFGLAALSLAACSTVEDAVVGPKLSPSAFPITPEARENNLAMIQPPAMIQTASANSLWRTGARAFFIDQRASHVGDILTVQIDINDSAKTSNTSSATRASGATAAVPSVLGLEGKIGRFLPPHNKFDATNALDTSSKFSNTGAGKVERSEAISLTIAAVVTGILPTGNLMIQGTQEVRTNTELRQLTVNGIVRPEDISSANVIKHTQIAEARISYGGRGDISTAQKAPGGQALLQKVWPF